MTTILASVAAAARAAGKGHDPSCTVSPDPVASGAALTVSGMAGHGGNWVNAWIYYSDGSHEILIGSVGPSGSFSLSGTATSLADGPAPSGGAIVLVYAGSANNAMKMDTANCSFSVS